MGIGSSAPAYALSIDRSANAQIHLQSSATVPIAALDFTTSRGTMASPTASQAGDFFGFFGGR